MGAIGAISNAVSDALAHLGVVVQAQPITPMRVHQLIQQAKQQKGSPST